MAERETSIRRGIDVLLALGRPEAIERGLSVTRISELLGREKSQVSRSLKTLAEYGLVDRDPDTLAYSVGWQVFALAATAAEQRMLTQGERILERLCSEIGEHAYLSVLHGLEAVVLVSKASASSIQAMTWVGRSYPALSSATGRALLSGLETATLETIVDGAAFDPRGPHGVCDGPAFLRRVAEVRETGYSVADEEFEPGLVSVAAPVRDHRGRVSAAINVSGPKFRLGDRLDETIRSVVEAATELSELASRREP